MIAGAVGHTYTTGGGRPIGLPANDPNRGAVSGVPIDQHLGLNLMLPLGQNGKIDLAYIWLESNTGVDAAGFLPDNAINGLPAGGPRVANRVQVFGGDLKWNFGNIVFDGGYAQSNVTNGDSTVIDHDNFAWHAGLGYDASRWGVSAGYKEIRPQFGAPGDWGRIGLWWNPTDIMGPEAKVHLNLTDQLKLTASGEWYTGTERNITLPASFGGGVSTGLSKDDHINRYTAELGYRLNDAWNLSLGAEWIDWDLKTRGGGTPGGPFTGGKPRERWYNIGLGYNLSDMARLSFLWQISDYDGKGVAGFSPFGNAGQDRATGSLLTTQLTVKF
jgi:predicted porin